MGCTPSSQQDSDNDVSPDKKPRDHPPSSSVNHAQKSDADPNHVNVELKKDAENNSVSKIDNEVIEKTAEKIVNEVLQESIEIAKKEIEAKATPSEQKQNETAESQNLSKTKKTEGGPDLAEHGAQMEDRFYNNKAFEKPDIDSSDPQQQDAALKIQTKYRQHNAKQVVDQKRQEVAAVKIQAGFRGYQDREKVKEMKKSISPASPKPEDENELDIDPNDPELQNAATKIQAGFKGYKARKEVQEIKSQEEAAAQNDDAPIEDASNTPDIDLNDPEVAAAATKIQAGFKGYKTRKSMSSAKNSQAEEKANDEPEKTEDKKEEEIDIDLGDPEVEKAAEKIQAGFKGMKARNEVKKMKEEKSSTEQPQEESKPEGEQAEEESKPEGEKAEEEPKPEEQQAEGEPKPEGEQAGEESKPEGEKDEEAIDIDLNDPEVNKAAEKIQAGFKGYKTRKDFKEKKAATDENKGDEEQLQE